MTDADVAMAKLPHPFVNGEKLASMDGQLVALVGKVDRVESGSFTLRTTDGKEYLHSPLYSLLTGMVFQSL